MSYTDSVNNPLRIPDNFHEFRAGISKLFQTQSLTHAWQELSLSHIPSPATISIKA